MHEETMVSQSLAPATSSFAAIVLIWVICTLHTVYKHHCARKPANQNRHSNNKKQIRPILRRTAISYLLGWTLCYVTLLLLVIFTLSHWTYFYDYNPGYTYMIITIMSFGIIGFLSFYSFTIARLYWTFRETIAKIRRRVVVIYLIAVVILVIFFTFFGATYYLWKNEFITHKRENQTILLFAAFSVCIFNMIMALSLVYLFSAKLLQLALLRKQTMVEQHRASNIDIEFNGTQKKLIGVITKQVLLNVCGIISFNVLLPLVVVIYYYMPHKEIYTYLGMILLGAIFHTIEMLSVILSFGFNDRCYYCCCGKCHKGCNRCCEGIAENQVKRKMVNDDYHALL